MSVVRPGRTAFGETAGSDLRDHGGDIGRIGLNGTGTRTVAYRAVANGFLLDDLAIPRATPWAFGQQHSVAEVNKASVTEIN